MIYSRYYLWSWDPVNGYQAWLSHDWLSSFVCVGDNECYSVVLLFFLTLSPTMSLWILLFFLFPLVLLQGALIAHCWQTRARAHACTHTVWANTNPADTQRNTNACFHKSRSKKVEFIRLSWERRGSVLWWLWHTNPYFFLHSTLI